MNTDEEAQQQVDITHISTLIRIDQCSFALICS